jgi:hypothetical protein
MWLCFEAIFLNDVLMHVLGSNHGGSELWLWNQIMSLITFVDLHSTIYWWYWSVWLYEKSSLLLCEESGLQADMQ